LPIGTSILAKDFRVESQLGHWDCMAGTRRKQIPNTPGCKPRVSVGLLVKYGETTVNASATRLCWIFHVAPPTLAWIQVGELTPEAVLEILRSLAAFLPNQRLA